MAVIQLRRPSKIGESQLKLREKLWPGLNEGRLWLRKQRKGFTTIPRSMPLILSIMDSMSKGKRISSTYFELWCRAHDECFVNLNKKEEHAFHAGFSGERAVTTWKDRIRELVELGFIDVKPGPSGDLSYAIIFNPYEVIKSHHDKNTPGLTAAAYNALHQRAAEIGANDLD